MSFDPHHDPTQRIEDILEAIASIKESVAGVSYEQFLANREKRQSVAYNIEVIGEAANAIEVIAKPSSVELSGDFVA